MTDAERLEEIARQFHETYEALSKDFCWETQPRSRVSWDEVPAANKALTRATVNKVVGPLLAEVERLRGVANHWTTGGDLVVEQKTLFRQVGWLGQSGAFYLPDDQADAMAYEGGGYSPVYQQIAKWVEGEGWDD